jgi:DNA primase
VTESVATNGVALGESHFELLKKFTHRAVLMFDADEAGKGATERGFELQNKLGLEVLVAPLPPGRDPADVVATDGAEGIRKIIDGGQPLMEFKLEQTIAKLVLDTPEARARAVREAAEVLGWHPDPVARHDYVFRVARLIGVDPEAVQRALSERRLGPPEASAGAGVTDRISRLPGHVKVEREALQLLLTRSREAAPWAEEVRDDDFTSAYRREVYELARGAIDEGSFEVDAGSATGLSPEALSLYAELTVGAADYEDEDVSERLREVFVRLRVFRLEREIRSRRTTLQDVNPLVDPTGHDRLFTELVALEAERRESMRRLQGAV